MKLKLQILNISDDAKLYIKIGIFNTLITYVLSSLVYEFLMGKVNLIVSGVVANLICIKFAFWMQRIFVFKSKNNWAIEYFKSNIGYTFTSFISIIIMYFLIKILNFNIWISQAITMPITFSFSYFINKNFTFKKL